MFSKMCYTLAIAAALVGQVGLEAAKPIKVSRDRAQVEKSIKQTKLKYAASIPAAPTVKVDVNGNAVMLWEEIGINTLINASTAPFGGSWTAPVLLSDPTLSSSNPTLAMDGNGDAVAVWRSGYPILGCDALYVATMPSGGAWSTALMLSTSDEAVFDNFTVDINEANQIVVGWSSFSISGFSISL
ncbi:MAG: hypothetical protein JSR46_08040, partial [Verrucomicrobia bacterium]|nr:hypothetical protein [Verrucomicrobiota bacterium]